MNFRFIKLTETFHDWMVFKECVLNKYYLPAFFPYSYDSPYRQLIDKLTFGVDTYTGLNGQQG